MEVRKEYINIGKAVFEGEIKSGAEGSIIVPDVKPDILKVLQADAETYLTEKVIEDGKLMLKGKILVNVLYIPECEDGGIQSLNSCFEFCETLKRPEFSGDMLLIASCDTERITYKLINSRKIGIDAKVLIGVEVLSEEACSVITAIDSDTAEVEYGRIKVNAPDKYKDFFFKTEDAVKLPNGKPEICEILKSNVEISEKEYRTLSGKVVVKGSARATVLYLTEEKKCDYAEFELPFTEVFDMDLIDEESDCEIAYHVCDTEFTVSNAGEEKSIAISCVINVSVRCETGSEIEAVTDCYFTDAEAVISRKEITVREITDRPSVSMVQKEMLEKGEGMPDISGIYAAVAKPYIASTETENGRIKVSGKTVVYILYLSDNPEMPVCGITEEIPFHYMLDTNGGNDVFLNTECDHISTTLASSAAVEIRCGISIKGKSVKNRSYKLIETIETEELPKEEGGMIIYFVKKGDTLRDVGKTYHVKCSEICEANGLEEASELIPGEKLIIPVKKK